MAEHTTTAEAIDRVQADPHQVHAHHGHGGPKLYALVLTGLLILTAITVGASTINFGSNMANVIISLVIASVKASLVALFFMHLRWDKVFCTILFFIGLILASGTMWGLLALFGAEASVPLPT